MTSRESNSLIRRIFQRVEPIIEGALSHGECTAVGAVGIAQELGFNAEQLVLTRTCAALHDVGLASIAVRITGKIGLTDVEREQMKQHVATAAEFIVAVPQRDEILTIIKHHHEWFDGSGYCDNLVGSEIPLISRIIAVAEVYDTLTRPLPWRPMLEHDQALSEIQRCSGTQFDPEIVQAFLNVAPKLAFLRMEL